MFGISPPPPPQVTAPVACALAVGCLLVGALILLWGRHLGRAFLCGIGIAIGLVVAEPIARSFGWQLLIVRLASTVTFALLALVLARVIWGVLAGLAFGIVAEMILLVRRMDQIAIEQQPVFQQSQATLSGWVSAMGKFLLDGLVGLCEWNLLAVLAAVGSAAALPLVISLIRDRLGRIFMTSLAGATGVTSGIMIALAQMRESLWSGLWARWYFLLAGVIVLTAAGVIIQYRGAFQEDRSEEKREAEPPDERQQPSRKKSKK